LGNGIIQRAVADDWQGALEKAHAHLAAVKAELKQADAAADLLEHWAHTCPDGRCQGNMDTGSDEEPLAIREVSKLLGVSHDVIRNWERNGLIRVRRNSYNNYRLFSRRDIERLQIIRMLSRAGYSHMAILRMFIELDGGNTRDLKKVLNTPRPDEDIFTAADHWLTTLQGQEKMAKNIIRMIEKLIEDGDNHEDTEF
jgi:DNA-binding transcriptional MerR regulator